MDFVLGNRSFDRGLLLLSASVLTCLLVGIYAASAFAAFPGSNGQIAWEGETTSGDDIFTMASNGTSQTNRTSVAGNDSSPHWHPDSGKLVFLSSRIGDTGFWTMSGDGGGAARLLAGSNDSDPSYTPDGSKIVFTSTRDGNSEIYIMNADTSGQTRLTNNSSNDSSPVVSPDGNTIAFVSTRDGNSEIYKMAIDGSSQTRLTNNSTPDLDGDVDPDWSPDGSKLVFASERTGGDYDIYVMFADGSAVSPVTNNSKSEISPVFSPDGSQFALASKVNSDSSSDYEIHRMNIDGTSDTQLTSNSSSLDDISPSWEPVPNANLTATATAVTGSAFVGQDVTFTLGVSNPSSPTVYGAKLAGSLPTGFTLKSATASAGSCTSGTINCTLGTLAGSASATVTVVATAPTTAGTYTASVTVEGNGGETSTTDNSASANTVISTDTVAPKAKLVLPSCKKNGHQLTGKSCTRYRYTRTNWKTLNAKLSDPSPSLGGVSKAQFQLYRTVASKSKKAKKSATSKKCVVYKTAKTTKTVKCSDAKALWIDGAGAASNSRGITHQLKLTKSPKAGKWVLRIRGVDAQGNITSAFTKDNQVTLNLKNAKKSKKK